jgi:predicted negative regulator of RcsB-dependent stress response
VPAVSDQERKGKASKDDEDEKESSEEETSEGESSEEEESEEEESSSEDEPSEREGAGEEEGEGAGEEEEDEAGDAARAQRVAAALGVAEAEGEGEAEAEAEAEAPAPPPNRAARRAEAAQRRKKRKASEGEQADKPAEDEVQPLPKDKNARAKELLKRRREQAGEAARPIQLLPGEMVDDALARGSSALGKWIRDHFGTIQWVVLGALVAGGGYLFFQTRVDKSEASAASTLMAGVEADRGRVMAEDKRSDEEKAADPTKVFKTADERSDTALAAYKKVQTEHAGSGAAILARLGEAGDYLDKHDYDHALEAFSAVSSSTLAAADPDVKGRALEGLGFAKEGKGDLDGALASFKELEAVDSRGFKELGLYHQGRVLLAKGDKDKAKDFLKQAREKLEQPTADGPPLHYLQQMTDEMLRRIDPSLVPTKGPTLGGPKGGSMTPEEIEKIKRQLEEAVKKHQPAGDKH